MKKIHYGYSKIEGATIYLDENYDYITHIPNNQGHHTQSHCDLIKFFGWKAEWVDLDYLIQFDPSFYSSNPEIAFMPTSAKNYRALYEKYGLFKKE